jgi:hypothetical protein
VRCSITSERGKRPFIKISSLRYNVPYTTSFTNPKLSPNTINP